MEIGAVKHALNTEIIRLRNNFNQAKIQLIRKMSRKAKTLREKKCNPNEKLLQKNERKVQALVGEILILKKVKPKELVCFILELEEPLSKYIQQSGATKEKVYAKLLQHQVLNEKYKIIKQRFGGLKVDQLMMTKKERLKLKQEEKKKKQHDKWNVETVNEEVKPEKIDNIDEFDDSNLKEDADISNEDSDDEVMARESNDEESSIELHYNSQSDEATEIKQNVSEKSKKNFTEKVNKTKIKNSTKTEKPKKKLTKEVKIAELDNSIDSEDDEESIKLCYSSHSDELTETEQIKSEISKKKLIEKVNKTKKSNSDDIKSNKLCYRSKSDVKNEKPRKKNIEEVYIAEKDNSIDSEDGEESIHLYYNSQSDETTEIEQNRTKNSKKKAIQKVNKTKMNDSVNENSQSDAKTETKSEKSKKKLIEKDNIAEIDDSIDSENDEDSMKLYYSSQSNDSINTSPENEGRKKFIKADKKPEKTVDKFDFLEEFNIPERSKTVDGFFISNQPSEATDEIKKTTKPDKKKVDRPKLPKKLLKKAKLLDVIDIPSPEKVVDSFFVTQSGEDYLTLAEPRKPDEVKQEHLRGNRKMRRAKMFGRKLPKPYYDNRNNGKFDVGRFDKPKTETNDYSLSKKATIFEIKKPQVEEKLHPSWEAKKQKSGILPFQGKKVVFE